MLRVRKNGKRKDVVIVGKPDACGVRLVRRGAEVLGEVERVTRVRAYGTPVNAYAVAFRDGRLPVTVDRLADVATLFGQQRGVA